MNILIIGKGSYIGSHVEKWLVEYGWKASCLDVLTDKWKTFDYSRYDAIVHVAGIVHRPDCKDWDLYYRVNTEMPSIIAEMARDQGVRCFVFLSSMAVYGLGKRLKENIITDRTPVHCESFYGKSKLLAEQLLLKLQTKSFNVVCVRPPSVYGKGCRGGYISGFTKVVENLPAIPYAYNNVKQSMLYIDNLCEFIKLAITNELRGCYCPQDDKAVSAIEITRAIAKGLHKQQKTSKLLGLFIYIFSFLPIVRKAYGGVAYSRQLSNIKGLSYVVVPFDEAMYRTVFK